MSNIQAQIPQKFTGILQLAVSYGTPSYDQLDAIQDKIMAMDKRWHPVEKLHCTLLHQSFPKKVSNTEGLRGDKALKALFKSPEKPSVEATLQLGSFFHCQDLATGRESIGVWVEGPMPEQMRDEILQSAGINVDEIFQTFTGEEASRKYHISLANLTGNGGDSPAYPTPANTSSIELQ